MCVCLAFIAYKWAAAAPNWRQDIARERERERQEGSGSKSGSVCGSEREIQPVCAAVIVLFCCGFVATFC